MVAQRTEALFSGLVHNRITAEKIIRLFMLLQLVRKTDQHSLAVIAGIQQGSCGFVIKNGILCFGSAEEY